MSALAALGFRALAPDLRGYGDSEAPADPAAYTILHVVGDAVGLDRAFIVGHDWGALAAWHLALSRPDRVRAVVALAVTYLPRGPRLPMDTFAARGDGFYIVQFQEPGRAERAFARHDVATVLNKFYSIESDDFTAPPGVEIVDFLEAPPSPPSCITGTVMVPAKFIVGDKDIGFKSGTEHYIKSEDFKSSVPDVEVAIIDGHHFLQQEKPERVNAEILSFLDKFTSKD
ncbi:hypothetical protein BAE44_0009145 [Dichanthelium oligosanthes]|uniref:AB hydrolase-1 domain-containing protein n=1 Tax=Dichanthelium oligosanthes TaxID=888268 RepID=A0A1E5VXL3_9POAL|nr:hypothetical protein BAE44_0009145 [Dichanthelium oligosanthes]